MIKSKMKIVIRILLIAIAIMLINVLKVSAATVPNIKVNGNMLNKPWRATNGIYCYSKDSDYFDDEDPGTYLYSKDGVETRRDPASLYIYKYAETYGDTGKGDSYGRDAVQYTIWKDKASTYTGDTSGILTQANNYATFHNYVKNENWTFSVNTKNAQVITEGNKIKYGPCFLDCPNAIKQAMALSTTKYGVNMLCTVKIDGQKQNKTSIAGSLVDDKGFYIVFDKTEGTEVSVDFQINIVNMLDRAELQKYKYIGFEGGTIPEEAEGRVQELCTITVYYKQYHKNTNITFQLTKPSTYTLEFQKTDGSFGGNLANVEFDYYVNGTKKGTVKSGTDGKFSITLDAKDTNTDIIKLVEHQYYFEGNTQKPYKVLGEIEIKVEKGIEPKNGQSYYVAQKVEITKGLKSTNGSWADKYGAGNAFIGRVWNVDGKAIEIKNEADLKPSAPVEISLYKIDANVSSSAGKIPLEGVEFTVTAKDEKQTIINNKTYTTDSNGILTIDDLPVDSIGKITIEIKESKGIKYFYELEGTMIIEIEKVASKENWAYIAKEPKIIQNFTNVEKGNEATMEYKAEKGSTKEITLTVKNQRKKMIITGYVWEDLPGDNKLSSTNGKKDSNEQFINGIEVVLHTDKAVYPGEPTKQSKFTEGGGRYEYEVYMGTEYYIEFIYNGYNYQHTKYTSYVVPGNVGSHATETETVRDAFNTRFGIISNGTTIDGVKISSQDNDLKATQLGPNNSKIYQMSAYIGPKGNASDLFKFGMDENVTRLDELNLGLVKRELADIAVRKDVYTAKTTIKGYSQTYNYNSRQLTVEEQYDAQGNVTNVNKYWDISQRASDIYYDQAYNRDVKASDYKYGTNDGNEANTDKLTLELTYIINVRNQSPTLRTKINQIAEYFDKELTIKEAYIGKRTGEKIKDITVLEGAATNIDGYKAVTLEPDENDKMLEPGTDMFIYLVFNIGELNKIKEIEETGRVYGNLTELMSYSTYYSEYSKAPNDGNNATYTEYKAGDIAGRIDDDSNPGNAKEIEDFQPATEEDATGTGKNREDDADRAPFIRIRIDTDARTTEGIVWEDARTKEVSSAMIGDGLYDKDTADAPIGGITVQLWEIKDGVESQAKIWDQSAKVWKDAVAISSSEDATKGQYTIAGFTPGNYYVKFIYGSDIETAKYNGQDYKSTIYVGTINANTGFDYNNPDANDIYIETQERYSDARDIMGNKDTQGTRAYVNNLYSGEITNAKESALRDSNGSKGQIQAKTGKIEIFIEKGGNNLPGLSGINHIAYILQNIDFGLVERPKAQIMLSKEVESAQIVLANGNTLFDVGPNGKSNAMWINKITPTELYKNNLLNYRTPSNNNEAITITMDNESMYGATIIAKYKIVAKNVGEVDYTGNQFYYSGVKGNGELVTTTVGTIIDYPGAAGSDETSKTRNNLRFDNSLPENAGWESYNSTNDADLVAESIKQAVAKYTSTIKKQINKELKPALLGGEDSEVSTTLVLSQVLSNQSDDNSYNNMVELASYVNVVGRRMAYTTVGNQDPDEPIDEIDGDMSQTITILPPFGQKPTYYIIAGVALVILTAGIILIKKKVIK